VLKISSMVGGQPPKGVMLAQDFRLFPDDNFLQYDPTKTAESNAEAAFDHFISSSGFARELSDDEVATYKAKFVGVMKLATKGHDRGPNVNAEQWQSWLKTAIEDEKPIVTNAFVDHINSQNLGFRVAKRPGLEGMTKRDAKMRLGLNKTNHPLKGSSKRLTASTYDVPTSFASADKWPDCREVIRSVLNQGSCGSCWAFSALKVLDSRLCIKTQGHPGGRFNGTLGRLSRKYATFCSYQEQRLGPFYYNGCQGGLPSDVFELAGTQGIPTGGDEGCIPYSYNPIYNLALPSPAPLCPRKCERAAYPRTLHNDKFTFGSRGTSYYSTDIRQVQQLLVTDGPVAVGVVGSSNEFQAYESGILRAGGCRGERSDHAVTLIGYGGDTCGGDPADCSSFYWRLINSWGDSWGEAGEGSVAWCEVSDFWVPGAIDSADLHGGLPAPTLPEVRH
jgi:hypothetical protein